MPITFVESQQEIAALPVTKQANNESRLYHPMSYLRLSAGRNDANRCLSPTLSLHGVRHGSASQPR